MDVKWLSTAASAMLMTGLVLGGCGSSGSDDDDDECIDASCGGTRPDPTFSLAGSWLATSNYRFKDDEPGVGSADIPDASRKEIFILTGAGTPQVYGCRDGEIFNVERVGDDTLSFDYLGIHYELDITDANTMAGSMDGEFKCDGCDHTETETGTVTLEKVRNAGNIVLGTLDYQLNGELDSASVSCYSETHVQGTWNEIGTGAIEFRGDKLGMGLINAANPAQVGGLGGDHDRPIANESGGWRAFGAQLLNGFRFEAEAEDDESDLQFAFTTSSTDNIVTIIVESSGTGTDASGDAFDFDFSGMAELNLTTVDASGDASSDGR